MFTFTIIKRILTKIKKMKIHKANPDVIKQVSLHDKVENKGEIVTGLGKQFYCLNNGHISIDSFNNLTYLTITKYNKYTKEQSQVSINADEMNAIIKFAKSHGI